MQILVVEDDAFLADCLSEALIDNGHVVCGVASTVADGGLVGTSASSGYRHCRYASARQGTRQRHRRSLTEFGRSRPHSYFSMSPGKPSGVIREARIGHACLLKPYTLSTLDTALEIVREIAREGGTSRALPLGLRLMRPTAMILQPAA